MDRATSPRLPPVIGRTLLARLMDLDDYFAAAEAAFLAHAHGRTRMPLPLHIEADAGGFHAKGAYVGLDNRAWVAVKVNSNFPGNPAKGLPTIQGAVLLYDASDGQLVGILDSMEITSKRTAAASALAARHLAREDAHTIAILGCGEQGRAQLAAISRVREIRQVFAWDANPSVIPAKAGTQTVHAVPTVAEATASADIIVTATTSQLHPDLMAAATVVADSLEQCCIMGDLHHAIAAGKATRESLHAELAEVVAGRKKGRTNATEITVFDSTGLAIQDVAAAALAYDRYYARECLFVEAWERGNQP
jgi:ornithine cyclodeaminase/alanine dehydrogenase-like protein (mu-crystallin family)